MTDTQTAGPGARGPIEAATLDMLRSVLMAAGSSGAVASLFSGQAWGAVVGGLMAVASAIWSYVASHPARTDPLAALLALLAHGGQAALWDAAAQRLVAAAVPLLEAKADAIVRAKAGVLAGPVDEVANAAIRDGGRHVFDHLKIS